MVIVWYEAFLATLPRQGKGPHHRSIDETDGFP
jgi:hypothetical protein